MIFDGFGEYVDHDYAGYDQRHADDRPHIEPLPEQQRGGQRHEHDTHAAPDRIRNAPPASRGASGSDSRTRRGNPRRSAAHGPSRVNECDALSALVATTSVRIAINRQTHFMLQLLLVDLIVNLILVAENPAEALHVLARPVAHRLAVGAEAVAHQIGAGCRYRRLRSGRGADRRTRRR